MMKALLLLLLVVVLCASSIECGRILISAPFGSKSHQNTYVPLIKALAARGHHITLITNYGVKDLRPLSNVTQIEMDELKIDPAMFGDVFQKAIGKGGGVLAGLSNAVNIFNMMGQMPVKVSRALYSNPQVLELMKTSVFDMVMVSQFFSPTGYPLAWYFNATLAMYSPAGLFPGIAPVLGDSDHAAYLPNNIMDFSDRMSLPQRIINTVAIFFGEQLFLQWSKSSIYDIVKKVLPDCPPLDDIEKETSLIFANTNPVFSYRRPMTPEMVEIGGIHCTPAKPLPPKLEAFVGEHRAGFIMFGVGSAVNMNDMPPAMVDAFIQVFRQLPQRVVWQWKGQQRENMPANIMTVDWMPQQDMLGHENCRLFLTHGGLNSMMEAVYHGVPVIGLPLSADQFANIARAQREGYATELKWKDITQESLSVTIHQMLDNPRYAENAERLSQLMKDALVSPVELAVFATEFNLRHNGAKHLRLGSRYLAPYQRAMIDVYAVLATVLCLPIALIVFLLRKCCKTTTTTTKPSPKIAKKKQ